VKATVVIATRNRRERLASAIESLRSQTLPRENFEVVVVDDASTDGTPQLLEEEAAKDGLSLRALRQDGAGGPAVARNRGWRESRGDLVAFLDDDMVAAPDWLSRALEAWGSDETVFLQGATGPIPEEEHRLGPLAYTMDVRELIPEFPTCNIFYPRAMLDRLGGFDENFPGPSGEDMDLAWRARREGATPRFAGEAHAYHAVVEMSPAQSLRRVWRWSDAVLAYARFPELRRERLHGGVFFNWSHYLLARVLLALLLRSRWLLPLRLWLALPYVRFVFARSEGRLPLMPLFVLIDLVETAGIVRGAVRHRVLIV
jgi:glycosyltransferase involved in cell wall biosynthesis